MSLIEKKKKKSTCHLILGSPIVVTRSVGNNYEILTKTPCESITENCREGKKTARKDLAKLFELHTNAEKERYIQRFALISNVILVLNVL